ncbi:hypothetical protein GQ457_17G000830 [Hibiscus cannabinus]
MNVPANETQFLSMLLKIMNAKKTMEIGFTGYSLLATALALPDDGRKYNIGELSQVPEIIFPMADLSLNHKYLIVHGPVLEYILEKNAYPREHQQLKELREVTAEKCGKRSVMSVPVDEAQFLSMLLRIMNAKKTMEIGVFTGYSLLATALALPDDGQVTAIDLDKEAYETGLPFIQKAGVGHKINFIQSDAFSVLDDLINSEENSSFDFIFVDAEKEDYMKFHEKAMKLVRIGGIIAYDNTLWLGSVAYGQDDEKYSGMPESIWKSKDFVVQFNELIVSDHRVETCLLSVGDGLTLCRRLY